MHRIPIRRLRYSPAARFFHERDGLIPEFSAIGMVRKVFDFFWQTARVKILDSSNDQPVKGGTPLVEQSPVSYFVGERVLELVLRWGKSFD